MLGLSNPRWALATRSGEKTWATHTTKDFGRGVARKHLEAPTVALLDSEDGIPDLQKHLKAFAC